MTKLGFQIPNFTFPGVPDSGLFERVAEMAQRAEGSGFDTVLLEPHGGDMNGFFLVKGTPEQLDKLCSSKDWVSHMTRASIHLQSSGTVRGRTDEAVMEQMELWRSHLPS